MSVEPELKVKALTAGRNEPSARFRIGQYSDFLQKKGIELDWLPAPIPKYPPASRLVRPFWAVGSILGRVPAIAATWSGDVTIFSRELVSTLMTLEPLTRRPRILDVDDSIWLTQRNGSVAKIADRVDAVIAGNDFVASWFSRYCRDVTVVPTGVDTNRFVPVQRASGKKVVIGWSGTSSNFPSLEELWSALIPVVQARPEVILRIVSDRPPRVPPELSTSVDFVPWTSNNEVASIQGFDIGLMPLADNDWSRGKCSYKMLLYMACGIPVVVSPVGMNVSVLEMGEIGYGVSGNSEWTEALMALVDDAGLRSLMGSSGREIVEKNFSLSVVATELVDIIRRVAK
jgi:glycosyltransferase involved in cell wall biosynthesis